MNQAGAAPLSQFAAQVRFLFEGERLSRECTPDSKGMEAPQRLQEAFLQKLSR